MLFVGYVKGQFETPIYEYEGFIILIRGLIIKVSEIFLLLINILKIGI